VFPGGRGDVFLTACVGRRRLGRDAWTLEAWNPGGESDLILTGDRTLLSGCLITVAGMIAERRNHFGVCIRRSVRPQRRQGAADGTCHLSQSPAVEFVRSVTDKPRRKLCLSPRKRKSVYRRTHDTPVTDDGVLEYSEYVEDAGKVTDIPPRSGIPPPLIRPYRLRPERGAECRRRRRHLRDGPRRRSVDGIDD
jgi:hypothetical protein